MPKISELPSIVPIFPLSGVLLLPRAPLPLHIFEPRYRAMARDAIAGEQYIAMVQPSGQQSIDPVNPPVFETSCLGKIVASEQLDDGRYNIVLRGVCRLRIGEELPLKDGYRRAVADYEPFSHDLVQSDDVGLIDRGSLFGALGRYLERRDLKANLEEVGNAPDEMVVNSLSVACPFGPNERQALLEAHDVVERARLLEALCEMDASIVANDNAPGPLH